MTRRLKLWLIGASLFTVVNIGGAGFAAASGEPLHTAAHAALVLLGAYFVWRLAPRARRQDALAGNEIDGRLEHLQESVDAVALEVERIGEAQRFIAQLAAERVQSKLKPRP